MLYWIISNNIVEGYNITMNEYETVEMVEKVNVNLRCQIQMTNEEGKAMTISEIKDFLNVYCANPKDSIIELIENDVFVLEALYFNDKEEII